MKHWLLRFGIALLTVLPCPTLAEPAVQVIDGDGLRIEGHAVRLWGIDAPELEQTCEHRGRETPCGEDARFLLGALVQGGDLVCDTKDIDRYGRTVARCFAGGHDLAGEMVRQGYALDYRRYSGGFYAGEEAEARANGRGMWAGEFVRPWEWRRR